MRRVCLASPLLYLCATSPMVLARQQLPPDPVFSASGLMKDRDYFSDIDFEHIDTLNGNLVMTFTDLLLPGQAGMDLRFQRTFNSNVGDNRTPEWRFGIAGVPMTIEYPDGPTIDAAFFPTIVMADGARHPMRFATPSHVTSTYWVTAEFWRYNTSGYVLELPNGYRLTYERHGAGVYGPAFLKEMRDPFGNGVLIWWDPDNMSRIKTVIQGFTQDDYRAVELEYANATVTFPNKMKFDSKEWNYTPLTGGYEAQSPAGTKWRYSLELEGIWAKQMTVTTPSGGQIEYEFGIHVFSRDTWLDPGSGLPVETNVPVVLKRHVLGNPDRGLADATWNYAYDTPAPQWTRVVYPDGRRTEYRYGASGTSGRDGYYPPFGSEWGLAERKLFDPAGTVPIEHEARYYTSLPVGLGLSNDFVVGHAGALEIRDLDRSAHIFRIKNKYAVNEHPYAWFHHPKQVEQGDRIIDYTYKTTYCGTCWIKGQVATETISRGSEQFVISRAYNDDTGFMQSETRFGVTTTFEPDTYGNLGHQKDSHDHNTDFAYEWGRVKNTTTETYTIERVIRLDGTVASEKRRGLTTSFSHDPIGRLTQVTPPAGGGHSTITTYDPAGTFAKVERGSGSTSRFTTYSLDGFGRVTSTINAENVKTLRQYDTYGRLTFESLPYVGSPGQPPGTSFEYDGLDRLKKKIHTDGHETTYAYSNGVDVTIVEQNAPETARQSVQDWFPFGDPSDAWLLGLTDAEGKNWAYTYNALGQLTQVTQPSDPTTTRTWQYKVAGGVRFDLVASEVHPENGTTTYTYDGDRLATKVTARGTLTFEYDSNDRVTKIKAPNDGSTNTVVIDYDDSDNRTKLENGFVKSSFNYDAANRLEKRTDHVLISGNEWLQKETLLDYDDWDNLTYIKYPSNREVTYRYDRADRVTRTPENTQVPAFAEVTEYHPSGGIRKLRMGNDIEETFDYDSNRYWLEGISTGPGGPVNVAYDYQPVGNIRQVTDANSSAFNQTLTYDKVDRLTGVAGFGQTSYMYDELGNRKAAAGRTYSYLTNPKRLSVAAGGPDSGTYYFDDAGFMTQDSVGSSYTPTPFDMIGTATVSGVQTVYAYDGDNTRKKRSRAGKDEYFFHGAGNQLLSEWENTASGIRWRRDYIYLGSRLVASATYKQGATFTISASASATEGSVAAASITMTTSDGLPLAAAASVGYSTVAGSATPSNGDYTHVSNTASFGAQAASGSTYPVNVQTLSDIYHENPESFQISLSAPQNGAIGTPSTTSVTITDNDPARIEIEQPPPAVLGAFTVAGWAADPSSPTGTGVSEVGVDAYNLITGAHTPLGSATYGLDRPDVDIALGGNGQGRFRLSGYVLSSVRLPPGIYKIQVWAKRTVTQAWDAANFKVITNIGLAVDTPLDNEVVNWNVRVVGWAANAAATSGTGITGVKVTATRTDATGQPVTFDMPYGFSRADVVPYFGAAFQYSGYDGWVTGLSPGQYRLDVCSYNGAALVEMKVRYVTVRPADPRMNLEVPVEGAYVQQPFWVQGWALDALAPASQGTGVDRVDVWAFPQAIPSDPFPSPIYLGTAQYGIARSDVAAVFGQQFVNAGFSLQVPTLTWTGVPARRYTIEVFPHNVITGTYPIAQAVYVFVTQ
jgi:YD repeat-containing protein